MDNTKIAEKIFSAVKKGNVKKLRELDMKYTVASIFDGQGNTGLHTMAKSQGINTTTMKEIAQRFIIVCDAQNKEGNTPLHIAVESQNTNMFNILLDMGVQTDIENNYNQKPIDIAKNEYFKNMLSSLNEYEIPQKTSTETTFSETDRSQTEPGYLPRYKTTTVFLGGKDFKHTENKIHEDTNEKEYVK